MNADERKRQAEMILADIETTMSEMDIMRTRLKGLNIRAKDLCNELRGDAKRPAVVITGDAWRPLP